MSYNATELLNNVPENAPYNIEKTQRVTILKRDLAHLNRSINDFLGVETEDTTISLTEMSNKLREGSLNLLSVTNNTLIEEANKQPDNVDKQRLKQQLTIDLVPSSNFDINTFTHNIVVHKDDLTTRINGQEKNPIGLDEINLTLNINTATGFVQQDATATIDSNNFDIDTKTAKLDFTKIKIKDEETSEETERTLFGAQSAEVGVRLSDPGIVLITEDDLTDSGIFEMIPSSNDIGFTKLSINPSIEQDYTLTVGDFEESTVNILSASAISTTARDALGVRNIHVPPINAVKDVTVEFTNTINTNVDVVDVNSTEEPLWAENSLTYPINILGKSLYEGIPRQKIISYIIEYEDLTTETITNHTPMIGDVVYEEIFNEDSLVTNYYVFNGENWDEHLNINKPLVITNRYPVGTFSIPTESEQINIVPDENAVGLKGVTVNLPGTVDYTFNIASSMLKTESSDSDTLTFNLSDKHIKVNSLTIPKIEARSTTISASVISSALKRKKSSIPVIIEDATFEHPVLLNAVTIELPENLSDNNKVRDIAIFETQILNSISSDSTNIILNLDVQNQVPLNETTNITKEDDKTYNILTKNYYLINRDNKQSFKLDVMVTTDSVIDVYQLETPIDTDRIENTFNKKIKLFSFKAVGPKVAKNTEDDFINYSYVPATKYTIKFGESFEFIPTYNITDNNQNISNNNTNNLNVATSVLEDFIVTANDVELTKTEIFDLFTYITTDIKSESLYYIATCSVNNQAENYEVVVSDKDNFVLELIQMPEDLEFDNLEDYLANRTVVGTIKMLNKDSQYIPAEFTYSNQNYLLSPINNSINTYLGSYYFWDSENKLNTLNITKDTIRHNGTVLCNYVLYNTNNVLCYTTDGIICNALDLDLPKTLQSFGISFVSDFDDTIKLDKILLQGQLYSPIKLNYLGGYIATNTVLPDDTFEINITEDKILFNPTQILTDAAN